MHLVVLVHGLFGNPGHMRYMEKSLQCATKGVEGGVHVHRARCMSPVGTFDGVIVNGELLYNEITQKIEELHATKLSIVGYSIGGLVSRYTVGLLEAHQIFNKVEPVLFATFATPHLGSRNVTNTVFGFLFNLVGPCISGKSGRDLFRKTDVLQRMADPRGRFSRGLKRFKDLYLFANTVGDRTVPFWTSFITGSNPFSSNLDVGVYKEYPFLVDFTKTKVIPVTEEPGFRLRLPTQTEVLLAILVPLLLSILIMVMVGISVVSWTKLLFRWQHHGSRFSEEVVGEVGEALNETLQIPEQANEQPAHPGDSKDKPEPAGNAAILSALPQLKLTKAEKLDLTNLNKLGWKKYAVELNSLNTHGEIVNRRSESAEGASFVDFVTNKLFASAFK